MCPTRHWFLPQPMRSLGLERVDQDTCSPSKCYVWLMLLCVSWDTHGCSVLSFSWRQKTCQQIFLSHIIHRARAEATAPAFCKLSSLSLMEMHAHTFWDSFGFWHLSKKGRWELLGSGAAWKSPDGRFCWVAPGTSVPAASFLLLTSPFPWVLCCFWSRSLCFLSLLIFFFLCVLRMLLA